MRVSILMVAAVMFITTVTTAQTYVAGITYNSRQHYGSCGRMIGVDSAGYANVVWMQLASSDPNAQRHVCNNVWNPDSGMFVYTAGSRVDATTGAGFACLALDPAGWCYPAFHGYREPDNYNSIFAGMDLAQGLCLFYCTTPRNLFEPMDTYCPRIARDVNGLLHVLSVAYLDTTGDSCRLFYSRATPCFSMDGFGDSLSWASFGGVGYEFVDSAQGLLHDIAASQITPTIARAWARSSGQMTDVWIQFSWDGGQNWQLASNLTQFIPPDSNCFAATSNARCCDRDTLRLKSDLSLLFDASDWLHVAFTTVAYYHWPVASGTESEQPTKAIIWHWSEMGNYFSPIAEYWIEDSLLSTALPLLTGHAILQRPSLSLDWSTGDLYCSYIRYDTSAWSSVGKLNGDVFVSVSTDNGATWSVGTNVTHTRPTIVPAPSGQNQNEQDATLADHVASNRLHLFYCLDRSGFDDELLTSNSMIYQRILTDSIAHTPVVPSRPFHVTVVECDTISHAEPDVRIANEYRLDAPYPNPFNSQTSISFVLPVRTLVKLRVYDILGREAQTVLNESRDAGRHSVEWAPQGLGSGLYFIRLETAFGSRLQKVVYLR